MKKVTALILFSFIKWFLLIALSFCIVFAVGELFDLMKYITHLNSPLFTLSSYFLFKIPYFLNLTLPLSALLSVFITIGNFKKTSELKAMRALGISSVKIFLPIAFVCLLITFFNFINLQYLMPSYYLRSHYIKERELRQNINAEIIPQKAGEILFWTDEKSALFMEEINFSSKEALNITYSQIDENYGLKKLIRSEKGEFIDEKTLVMKNALARTFEKNGFSEEKKKNFYVRGAQIGIIKHIVIHSAVNHEFLSLSEQLKTWRILKMNMYDWKEAAVGFLEKISFALAPLFLFFLAARFLTVFPHSNTFLAIGVSIAYSFFYWIITNVGAALSLNPLPYFLGPFINNIFTLFLALYLSKIKSAFGLIKK